MQKLQVTSCTVLSIKKLTPSDTDEIKTLKQLNSCYNFSKEEHFMLLSESKAESYISLLHFNYSVFNIINFTPLELFMDINKIIIINK